MTRRVADLLVGDDGLRKIRVVVVEPGRRQAATPLEVGHERGIVQQASLGLDIAKHARHEHVELMSMQGGGVVRVQGLLGEAVGDEGVRTGLLRACVERLVHGAGVGGTAREGPGHDHESERQEYSVSRFRAIW